MVVQVTNKLMELIIFCCFIYNEYPQNQIILFLLYLIAVYDETDYPIRMENGESWRPFWWYNATGGWPSQETDTLGGNVMAID